MTACTELPLGDRLIRQDVVRLWPDRFSLASHTCLSLSEIQQMDSAGLAFLLQWRRINPDLKFCDPSDRAQALAEVHGVPGCFSNVVP